MMMSGLHAGGMSAAAAGTGTGAGAGPTLQAHLQGQLGELRQSHDVILSKLSKLEGSKHADVARLQGEVRLKTYEATQLSTALATAQAELEQCRLQRDMLQEQCQVHRAEYAELESRGRSALREMEAEREQMRDRLAVYENLEVEIDQAVLLTAQATREEGGAGAGDGLHPSLVAPLAALPTHPKRRLRHALELAQRLIQSEEALRREKRHGKALQSALETCRGELEEARHNLALTDQPYQYLLDRLREEQSAANQLREQMDTIAVERDTYHDQVKKMRKRTVALEQDLAAVLQDRQELLRMRHLLTQLETAPPVAPSTAMMMMPQQVPPQPQPQQQQQQLPPQQLVYEVVAHSQPAQQRRRRGERTATTPASSMLEQDERGDGDEVSGEVASGSAGSPVDQLESPTADAEGAGSSEAKGEET